MEESGKVIHSFRKSSVEDVRVRKVKYMDRDLIDIRVFVEKVDGSKVPTQKGISLNVKLLPELKKAIELFEKENDANTETKTEELSSV